MTYIDAPLLNQLVTTFYNEIDFDGPRLAQFISRTPILVDCSAQVKFYDGTVIVRLLSNSRYATIEILCRDPVRQLSSVTQVCNSCFPPFSMIEDLYIQHHYSQLVWKGDAIKNTQWLELLLPFPAVKNLYLSKDFVPGVKGSLQKIIVAEVFPSLQNFFVGRY